MAAIEEAAQRFGLAIATTAEAALLDELAHAHGQVVFYRQRVSELSREQMTYGAERVTRTARLAGGGQQVIEDASRAISRPNVWIQLLNEAQRHYAEVAATIARLDIETRMISMAEQEGAFITDAMTRILTRMGVSDDPRLPLVIGEVLAELDQ